MTETDDSNNHLVVSEEDAFNLIAHLVASAEISVFEPELYGPFRLLDAASILIGAMLKNDPGESKKFLRELKQEIDDKKGWLMWDRDGFRQLLPDVAGKVAGELKRRHERQKK
ncbi:MAG: DUF6092 family protein [Candidatus Bipolaricaulia bacterium]